MENFVNQIQMVNVPEEALFSRRIKGWLKSKTMREGLDRRGRKEEKGMSILEALIASSIILLATFAFCHQIVVTVKLFFINELQRNADALAVTKFTELASLPRRQMKEGAGMILDQTQDPPKIRFEGAQCVNEKKEVFCDKIVVSNSSGKGASEQPSPPTGCYNWPCAIAWEEPIPTDTQLMMVRRWLVTTGDASRGEMRVAVAVFIDEKSTQPIVMRQTNIMPH
jgi:hypothetical protein